MLNTLYQVMNMCLDKKMEKNKNEIRVDIPAITVASTNNFFLSEQMSSLNNHKIPFKISTTFGLNDDKDSLGDSIQSPKFNVIIKGNSDATVNVFNLESSDDENLCESSTRIIKDKFGFLKLDEEPPLFTVNDENQDEELADKVFYMNDIVILDSEIAQAKKLTLEDESGELLFNQVLNIDARGLVKSLRKLRDGYVFFGPIDKYKNCIINDFVLNYRKELCMTRLFVIFYDRKEQNYYIRNINDTKEIQSLIYVKLTKPFPINKKAYFSFGRVLIAVTPISQKKEFTEAGKVNMVNNKFNDDHIKIIMYRNFNDKIAKEKKDTYYFNSSNSPVLIGRNNCEIELDEKSLSKKQCAFVYNYTKNCWEITDGFNNRPSTNGTWLMINSKYQIQQEKTFIKVGNNVIKINMI